MITDGKGSNRVLRKDAHRRRERLLRAALELHASEGFDISLEKIADRAKVGRTTLYRNFPDRGALVAAVLEMQLKEVAAQVEEWGDRTDAFLLGVRALANLTIASGGFSKIVSMDRWAPSVSGGFRIGVEKILAKPLESAKAAGLVRADFHISDVHLAALMVAGGGLDKRGSNPKASIDRAMQLLASALRPQVP